MTAGALLALSDRELLGRSIRQRRLAVDLTLVALAEAAGLSQPFLSQVENGRAQPSMASLHRIAQALGTTPQALFAGAAPVAAVVARSGDAEHVPTIDTAGESRRRLLLPGGAPFRVVEMVGLATRFLEPWSHEGFEALYVLAGPVEVDVAGEITSLATGDFLSYPAQLPHRYRSPLGATARLLLIETQVESVPGHRSSDHPLSSAAPVNADREPTVRLERWFGPWPDDDKDANLKSDIALYSRTDPLRTIDTLAADIEVPSGAIVRYVLARWASEGASGLLEIGPTMVRRLHGVCDAAEAADDDSARLAAYHQLRQMLSWLHHPLAHPDVYGA